jgi:hypothetical protein
MKKIPHIRIESYRKRGVLAPQFRDRVLLALPDQEEIELTSVVGYNVSEDVSEDPFGTVTLKFHATVEIQYLPTIVEETA